MDALLPVARMSPPGKTVQIAAPKSSLYSTRYVWPGAVCQTKVSSLPARIREPKLGRASTTTVKLFATLRIGGPLSLTPIVNTLVLGASVPPVGQEKNPVPRVMVSPAGTAPQRCRCPRRPCSIGSSRAGRANWCCFGSAHCQPRPAKNLPLESCNRLESHIGIYWSACRSKNSPPGSLCCCPDYKAQTSRHIYAH